MFAYGLVFCIIASFIIKIIQIPDFYRKKYLPILVLMCVITVSKFICGILEFPIDVSGNRSVLLLIQKKGCFIIAYLDGILLFLNIIFHNVFTIETVRFHYIRKCFIS